MAYVSQPIEASVRGLLREFREAERDRDLVRVTSACCKLILRYIAMSNHRMAKKYIKILSELKILWDPFMLAELFQGYSTEPTLRHLHHLSHEIEAAVSQISWSAKSLIEGGHVDEAVRAYELCLLLSKAKLGGRYVEEQDDADDLAIIYLTRREFKKALRTFADGASFDGGREKLSKFFSGDKGPPPRVIREFLGSHDDTESASCTNGWSNVGHQ